MQNEILLIFLGFFFLMNKHEGEDQTRPRTLCLQLRYVLSFSLFVFQNSLLCVFSKGATWGSLRTSVHNTGVILMDSKESLGYLAEGGPAGQQSLSSLWHLQCWHILSQGHLSSVIPIWQWACAEMGTVFLYGQCHNCITQVGCGE